MATTPLMNMDLPVVGVDSGTTGNNKYITAFNVIDSHDHTSGKGTQVPAAGININSSLSFSSFSATSLRSTNFTSQGGTFSSASDNRSAYVVGNELYFRDGAGNNVQLTNGGSVAGASGSIGGLSSPASAAFSTNIFIWKSDSTTFAKMRHSDLELYPFSAGASSAITLKAPSLAGSYTITFPTAVPGSNQYLQMDNSGTLSTVSADSIGSAMTSTGANAIAAARTRSSSSTVGVGGVAVAASSATNSTSSTSFVDVDNQSVTITTSGRPIFITCRPVNGTTGSGLTATGSAAVGADSTWRILRDGATNMGEHRVYCAPQAGGVPSCIAPPGSIVAVDFSGAGTYTYKLQVKVAAAGQTASYTNISLVAFEL